MRIAVLVVEIIAITFLLSGHIDMRTALALHFGLGGAMVCVILVLETAGYLAGDLQKYVLQMLVAGPMGAASAMIGEQLASRPRAELLAAWYETIAPPPQPVVTLADRILDDQVVRAKARLPRSVDLLIRNGTMREKQALFASIVSDGRIEGVNLIEKAMRSRDQRVRVQAAAVSAFIRSKLRKSVGAAHANSNQLPTRASERDVSAPAA